MGDKMTREYCASVFIINPEDKKILLVKHKKFHKWVQPGGHMEANEVPEETAVREVYEETKIKIKIVGEKFPRETDYIRPLGIQKNCNLEGIEHVDFIYAAIPTREQDFKFDPNESTEIGWFSRNELDRIDCFPDIRITMDYILQNIIR